MQTHWAHDAIFYHINPLGLCGAPARNDFTMPAQPRLEQLDAWIPHLAELGINAVYLGPLFESTAHGYDTADYYHVDRRLGTRETLGRLVAELHVNGMRVILDGVFNVDGLRLDVADTLDLDFQRELARFARGLRPDFWLGARAQHRRRVSLSRLPAADPVDTGTSAARPAGACRCLQAGPRFRPARRRPARRCAARPSCPGCR